MGNKYTNRNLLDYNFNASDYASINQAAQKKTAAEQAYNNLGDYNFIYGRQSGYDNALDAVVNRKKFSYNLNGDALYQQYKDNYINQSKMAMMDTMGQAAAMTGGYGNSYAATVGNQAYQASLQNLNNMIPQLYQLALDSYKAEGDRLNNNLNVFAADRELEENSYNNKYTANLSRLTADRDYYRNEYDDIYDREHTSYVDYLTSNNENYWNEYNQGYKAEQDRIANANAAAQLKIQQDAQKIAELQAGVVRDTNGNIIGVANNAKYANSEIPDYIYDKIKSFDNDFDLDDYLHDLETNNTITNQQARELFGAYAPGNTVNYKLNGVENSYYVLDDGGRKIGKVNDNAKVKIQSKDEKGNITYKEQTMEQIYNDLVKNGKTSKEAKKMIKDLQDKLGIK